MRLLELNPVFKRTSEGTDIEIDCPACKTHRIPIRVDGEGASHTMVATQPFEEMFNNPTWDEISITPGIHHLTADADGNEKLPRACQTNFIITEGEVDVK